MNKKSLLNVAAVLSSTLAFTLSFNNCSGVNFETQKSSVGDQGTGGGGGGTTLVPYDDTFVISNLSKKADVLLMLDNSGSMSEDLKKLAQKLDGLIAILDQGGIDWQMCYTTTDVYNSGGQILNWAGVGSRVLLPSTANKSQVFLDTMNAIGDGGSGNEQGIFSTKLAIENSNNSDCFRPDAALSVVLISDEDEHSCGGRCENATSNEHPGGVQHRQAYKYANQYVPMTIDNQPETLIKAVRDQWSEKPFIFNSIIVKPDDFACYDSQDVVTVTFFGKTYARLQSLTGGVLGNICADSFASQLTAMGESTKAVINSVTLKCTPVGMPTVTLIPADPSIAWQNTGNKVVFSKPLSLGSSVRVQYNCLQ